MECRPGSVIVRGTECRLEPVQSSTVAQIESTESQTWSDETPAELSVSVKPAQLAICFVAPSLQLRGLDLCDHGRLDRPKSTLLFTPPGWNLSRYFHGIRYYSLSLCYDFFIALDTVKINFQFLLILTL